MCARALLAFRLASDGLRLTVATARHTISNKNNFFMLYKYKGGIDMSDLDQDTIYVCAGEKLCLLDRNRECTYV